MNASPAILNPVAPAQTQAAAGKQQDTSTPDVPFSRVLSNEMAHGKHGGDANRKADAASDSKSSSKADAKADVKVDAKAAAKADAKRDSKKDAKAADATDVATGLVAATDKAATDKPAALPQPTDASPASPDTFLGLAIQPDSLKLAPASKGDALPQQSGTTGGEIATALDPRKGRSQTARQGDLHADLQAEKAAGSQKSDAALAGKTSVADFSEQLIAARQSEAAKIKEPLTDLMTSSTLRVTPQAPLDAPTPLTSVADGKLAPSVGSTAWGQALGDKVVWMAAGAQQTATLTLNPPNLGPLHIELQISNDQATASFFSTHPDVRHALESAFPRLREMMNDAGIQLGQATVSADTPQQNDPSDRQAQRAAPSFPGMDESSSAGLAAVQAPVRQSGRGLIDTFA